MCRAVNVAPQTTAIPTTKLKNTITKNQRIVALALNPHWIDENVRIDLSRLIKRINHDAILPPAEALQDLVVTIHETGVTRGVKLQDTEVLDVIKAEIEIQEVETRNVDLQKIELLEIELQEIDHQEIDHQEIDLQGREHRETEHQETDHQGTELQETERQEIELQKIDQEKEHPEIEI